MKRISWIDYGKGITAILVFIGHVFYGIYESPILNNYSGIFLWLVQLLYIFHMPVFFALSGILFKPLASIPEWVSYVKKKAISLLIPYVFFCLFWFVTSSVAGDAARNQFGLLALLRIPIRPIAISWFLYVLWLISVLYGFLSIYLSRQQLLLVSLAFFAISLFFPIRIYLVYRVMSFGSCFVLGYYLKESSWAKQKNVLLGSASLLALYMVYWSLFDGTKVSYSGTGLTGLMYLVSIVLAFNLFASIADKLPPYLERLGKSAIEIYLYHAIIVSTYRIVMIKLGFTDLLVHVFLGIPITWGATMLATYLSQKISLVDAFLHPSAYLSGQRSLKPFINK